MKLLAGTTYDPAAKATVATSSLLGMTAIDTTNLRLTFTAPSHGAVLVRARTVTTTQVGPQVLFGVLDHTNSDAVVARQAPITGRIGNNASAQLGLSVSMLITGLVGGQSYTYDLAYGVEFAVASSVLSWGGPNDTIAANSNGAISYEIWSATGLLAAKAYDPSTAATVSTAAPAAVTAIDTTNLRVTFTCPSAGSVYVRLRGVISGTTATLDTQEWCILDGATVRFRSRGIGGSVTVAALATTDQRTYETSGLVTGLTPGTSYTWDAAWNSDASPVAASIKWGGPNNTTQDDAWGQFTFEVWRTDDVPMVLGSVA